MAEQETLDEEWERSEEALRRLQIATPSSTPSPTPTPIPTPNINQGGSSSGQIYEEGPKPVDFIDSALSDTLQNPQERMNILKFENKILHFVKSRFV